MTAQDKSREAHKGSALRMKALAAVAVLASVAGALTFVSSGATAEDIAAPGATTATEQVASAPVAQEATSQVKDDVEATASEASIPATGVTEEAAAPAPAAAAEPAVEVAAEPVAEQTVTETVVETTTEVEAPQAAEAPAVQQTVWTVDVNCAGGQADIDTCVGATNFLPAQEVLGVPYYAQHDYLGGNAWWNIEPGHTVIADGVTYVATEIRRIYTGGSSDQIVDMQADAFLQTCLEDGVHSRVIALVRA